MSKFAFEKGFRRLINGWAFENLGKFSDRPVAASLEYVEMNDGQYCLDLVLFLECSGLLFDKEFLSELFGIPEENVLTTYKGEYAFMSQILFYEQDFDKIVESFDGMTLKMKGLAK